MTVGILTTLRMPGNNATCYKTIESWILYHLSKGIDKIFMFFDQCSGDSIVNEPLAALCELEFPENVVVIRGGNELKSRLEQECVTWPDLHPFYTTEVTARQALNAELAMRMAVQLGLRWLLHIDIDELWWTEQPSLLPHLAWLEEQGVDQMTYVNHEGSPESSFPEDGDYFTEVTLFKMHYLSLPLSSDARLAMEWWKTRTNHGQYLLAYDCGKSAARVRPDIIPNSVHTWKQANSSTAQERGNEAPGTDKFFSRTAICDARFTSHASYLPLPPDAPCILHYVSCGGWWFTEKYGILGTFGSEWFGGALPIAPCFHLDSRDILQEGGKKGARKFYERQVMVCPVRDSDGLQKSLQSGVCKRMTGPRDVINNARIHRQRLKDENAHKTCKNDKSVIHVEDIISACIGENDIYTNVEMNKTEDETKKIENELHKEHIQEHTHVASIKNSTSVETNMNDIHTTSMNLNIYGLEPLDAKRSEPLSCCGGACVHETGIESHVHELNLHKNIQNAENACKNIEKFNENIHSEECKNDSQDVYTGKNTHADSSVGVKTQAKDQDGVAFGYEKAWIMSQCMKDFL